MARSKSTKISTSEAIAQVLGGSRKPMRVPDIAKAAIPLTALKGKTPGQTIYSVLYAELRKENPRWERVEKGTFKLIKGRKVAAAVAAPAKAKRASSKAKSTEQIVAEEQAAHDAEVTPDPK